MDLKTLSPQEVAAILAGLRALQRYRNDPDVQQIATDNGEFPALDDDGIDRLFESLNSPTLEFLDPQAHDRRV